MKTLNQRKYVPKVSLLTDEDMLKAYQDRIKSYSKRAQEVLDILTFKDGVIEGSNSFANVALASEHLALPSQVLHDSELNPGFFIGNYEDLGLVLRTNGDSFNRNDYNARNLYEQLKRKGFTPSEETPVMVSLRGLSLEEDGNSPYGLIHRLGEQTQIIPASELSHENHKRKFSRVDERGIPIFDSEGVKTFYTRQGGLDRVFLYMDLNLDSNWDRDKNLADSNTYGRVAVVENFSSGK